MRHRNITGAYTHHLGYIQDTDPELLGNPIPEGMAWVDTSGTPPYPIYIRNHTDDGWNAVGAAGAPTGSAGGDLFGSFPNPGVQDNSHTHNATTITDAELVALAAAAATGLVARTSTATYAQRTLTGPAAGLTVTNGSGVSGNPTLALANDLSGLEALTGVGIPYRTGTDAWAMKTLTITRRVYRANATWTKPTGLLYLDAETEGAGGGGGGTDAISSTAQGAGGGGGGGGYARKMFLPSDLGATEAVVVGAAGTAGAAGSNNGGNGGDSTFSTLTGNGGLGGVGGNATATGPNTANGGLGGGGTGGTINVTGSGGGHGFVVGGINQRSNYGGSSHMGGSARVASSGNGDGSSGAPYGGGGSGGSASGTASRAGGAGDGGVVILTEYTLA